MKGYHLRDGILHQRELNFFSTGAKLTNKKRAQSGEIKQQIQNSMTSTILTLISNQSSTEFFSLTKYLEASFKN